MATEEQPQKQRTFDFHAFVRVEAPSEAEAKRKAEGWMGQHADGTILSLDDGPGKEVDDSEW